MVSIENFNNISLLKNAKIISTYLKENITSIARKITI